MFYQTNRTQLHRKGRKMPLLSLVTLTFDLTFDPLTLQTRPSQKFSSTGRKYTTHVSPQFKLETAAIASTISLYLRMLSSDLWKSHRSLWSWLGVLAPELTWPATPVSTETRRPIILTTLITVCITYIHT